jgi:hypothetical protein
MVMVAALADEERDLAVVAAQGVGIALVREPLEVAVDGREPDAVELAVQLLGGDRPVGAAQGLDDRVSLVCASAHSMQTIINLNYYANRAVAA